MLIWRRLKRLLRRRGGLLSLAAIILCLSALMVHSVLNDGEMTEVDAYEAMAVEEPLFFGLSDEGILTLYQGPPELNQVIETFFRIDTERLKTERSRGELDDLKAGIQVVSAEEYELVLTSFRPYAADY